MTDTPEAKSLIELSFGSIRHWVAGERCCYRSAERTHTQDILEAIVYNLKCIPRILVCRGAPDKRKISHFVAFAHEVGERGK